MDEKRVCPHCGAPLISEVCQYCGQYVGTVATAELAAEYPVLECRNAALTFWNTIFPLIFALGFGFFGFLFPLIFIAAGEGRTVYLICIPFALIGVGAAFVLIRQLVRFMLVSVKGETKDATVYGYMDDTVSYNGANGQVVKLLIDTREGKRFLFLPLGGTSKPYAVNGTVHVKVYRRYFRIIPEVYAG